MTATRSAHPVPHAPPARPVRLLLAPHHVSSYAGVALIVASPAKPFDKRRPPYEFAGAAFHVWHRRVCNVVDEPDPTRTGSAMNQSVVSEEDAEERMLLELHEQRKREHGFDPNDYYELIGIGHLGMNATDKQIKRAYQATVIRVHPDKKADAQTMEEANAHFRLVQKAYEVLSDPVQRKGYDSQLEFDDWIPKGTETIADFTAFYKLYGPVFESNARFSNYKPVPMLGSEFDAEPKVKAFYTFWRTFSSWRDFSADDEHKPSDIETAESRDERRWMQRQNEVQREKRKRAEYQRIQTMVERAYTNDPRIGRFKAEIERAKEEVKRQKEDAKRKEEEAKRLELEAKQKVEQEERERAEAEKKDKLAAKNRIKKALKRLRDAAQAVAEAKPGVWSLVDMEATLEQLKVLEPKPAKDLADAIEQQQSLDPLFAAAKDLAAGGDGSGGAKAEEAKSAAPAAQTKVEPAKKDKLWTPEALSSLAKGLAKHPGGTRNRWQVVAAYLQTTGFDATPDECIAAAKTLAEKTKPVHGNVVIAPGGSSNSAIDAEAPWTAEDIKALQSALETFPASEYDDSNERWSKIAEAVKTHSKKQCAAKYMELKEKAKASMTTNAAE